MDHHTDWQVSLTYFFFESGKSYERHFEKKSLHRPVLAHRGNWTTEQSLHLVNTLNSGTAHAHPTPPALPLPQVFLPIHSPPSPPVLFSPHLVSTLTLGICLVHLLQLLPFSLLFCFHLIWSAH